MTDNLVKRLREVAEATGPNFSGSKIALDAADRIEELEAENEKLRKALDVYQRERDRFRHANPEITGEYFLTGGHGERDDNLLPEFVTVCAAYGAGWEQVYQKTERTVSYEGS